MTHNRVAGLSKEVISSPHVEDSAAHGAERAEVGDSGARIMYGVVRIFGMNRSGQEKGANSLALMILSQF